MKKLLFLFLLLLFIGCDRVFSPLYSLNPKKFDYWKLSSLSLEEITNFWIQNEVNIKTGIPGFLDSHPGIEGCIRYSLRCSPENERAKYKRIWITVHESQMMALEAMDYTIKNASWGIFLGGNNKFLKEIWWYTLGSVYVNKWNTIIRVNYIDYDWNFLSKIAAEVAARVDSLSEII